MKGVEMKGAFGSLLADEPSFRHNADQVIQAGRRRRRVRITTRVSAALALATVTSALLVSPLRVAAPPERTQVDLLSFASDASGATTAEHRGRGKASPVLRSLMPTIRSHSPQGVVFSLAAGELPGGEVLIDGTVDDGAGAGRLFIALGSAGSTTLDPCSDHEFRLGASCTTEVLNDGSRVILRGVVGADGPQTIAGVLVRSDGSGLYIEAGNWVNTSDAPRPTKQGEDAPDEPGPTVSRDEPVYTSDQLATLLRAIDAQL